MLRPSQGLTAPPPLIGLLGRLCWSQGAEKQIRLLGPGRHCSWGSREEARGLSRPSAPTQHTLVPSLLNSETLAAPSPLASAPPPRPGPHAPPSDGPTSCHCLRGPHTSATSACWVFQNFSQGPHPAICLRGYFQVPTYFSLWLARYY